MVGLYERTDFPHNHSGLFLLDWPILVHDLIPVTPQLLKVNSPLFGQVDAFLEQKSGAQPGTLRKYKRLMGALEIFARHRGIDAVSRVRLEDLDAYRKGRKVNALTWTKELQLLRQFFGFCQRRKWCEGNPAKDMEMPSEPKPSPREPYTAEEIARILAACETFGKGQYERLRARAAILLMRYYGLRVSDVATLERARVRSGQLFLHALKNGAPLWLPLYPAVEFALECLPAPRGATDTRYFFWTGLGSRDGQIKTFDRTLQAVFTESRVAGAHAHRFRHTLATEILSSGSASKTRPTFSAIHQRSSVSII